VKLTDWGTELLQEFAPIARALDAANGCGDYSAAVQSAQAALRDAAKVPSARVLGVMASAYDNSFTAFTRERSQQTRQALLDLPWGPAQQARFEAMARQSLEDQKKIEAGDSMPFEIFRQQYVSASRLGLPIGAALNDIAYKQGKAQHQGEPSHQR
jgi:glutamate--cysteine ligase